MTAVSLRRAARLAAIVAVLALLAPIAFVPRATKSSQYPFADHPFEVFRSRQTGYTLFWDPDSVSLEGESSEPDGDWIRFVQPMRGGDAFLDVWAFLAPGVTPTECLSTAVDALAADPSTRELEALTEEGGPPVVEDRPIALLLTVEGEDEPVKFAVRLECRELVPGQALLLKSVVMPANIDNEETFPLELLEIHDPEWYGSSTFVNFDPIVFNPDEPGLFVPGETGEPIGTLLGYIPCGSKSAFLVWRSEDDDEGVVLNSSSFSALDDQGNAVPTSLVAWTVPELNRGTSLELGPGENALLQIMVDADPGFFDVRYSPPSGEEILVDTAPYNCGAAAGAPVLIDLE